MLLHKKVILGITGSIAAYKSASLTRLLVKAGAEVQVLMTPTATHFISPLTLSTLSRRPVYTEAASEEGWNNHVELGLWADAYVVAPATANTLAHMAGGLCDNMVTAVYLSARCPVYFAPAMDLDMWQHPATQANVKRLISYGNKLIPVGEGELASGLHGAGRMAEPEDIIGLLTQNLSPSDALAGKRVLITAGPTYEPLDPVRYLGNHSTGTMGVELALHAARLGARVDLVLGPSNHRPEAPGLLVHHVQTAREMYEKAGACFEDSDIAIFAAAVSDYRPTVEATDKIKKKEGELSLNLTRNPDIAAELGKLKRRDQLTVGFALETRDEESSALDKLKRKNFDLIVLNSLRDAGAGFGPDTNHITIYDRHNKRRRFELKSKKEVAVDILQAITEWMK